MIFSRRALQLRISELRGSLDDAIVDKLASRLNRHGKDRLAAMWEVAVFHALSRQGSTRSEDPLHDGRRPDIAFVSEGLSFTADVTIVSDDGLDEQNPVEEFGSRVEALKKRLGLQIGGMTIRILSRKERVGGRERTMLRLPSRNQLDRFIKERLEPNLRSQIEAGRTILRFSVDDDTTGLDLFIDPQKCPFNSLSYPSYDVPTIKERNPLYNVLKAKARQLRAAEGIVGIIVGDADSTALSERRQGWNEVGVRDIIRDFLRQHSSIGFVFVVSVREKRPAVLDIGPRERWLHGILEIGSGCPAGTALDALFRLAMRDMPKPVMMPVNGARRAQEVGYGRSHYGVNLVSKNRVRISSRDLMEILAGRRTIDDFNAMHRWRSVTAPSSSHTMFNQFDKFLTDGRLPVTMEVVRTGEDDSDDWIELEFGDSDPAISPIR